MLADLRDEARDRVTGRAPGIHFLPHVAGLGRNHIEVVTLRVTSGPVKLNLVCVNPWNG